MTPPLPSMRIARAAAADEESLVVLDSGAAVSSELIGADRLSAVALRACTQLVHDLDETTRNSIGMVIGTEFGCLETDRAFDRSRREAEGRFASPAAFSRTLPSSVPAELSLRFGLRGPGLVVTAGKGSTSLALRRAVRWMAHFQLEYCIAGGMDWHGVSSGAPESCSVALVLLGRSAVGISESSVSIDASCGAFTCGESSASDLIRLADWIQTPRPLSLLNGVTLNPPTQTLVRDGR